MAFTVRTDPEFEEALNALVQAEGFSRQEIVRRAVMERSDRSQHGVRVSEATQRMMLRWADVLHRLGSE